MTLLEARSLSYSYTQGPRLLHNVNMHVDAGECVALTGPSGCGKSTLCHILSGIIPRSIRGNVEGDVLLTGIPVQDMSLCEIVKSLGIVFQNPDSQLFFPTVEDEIAFGPENLCIGYEDMERRITESLNMVNMQDYRLHNSNTLSGGQKQLIALAAVLALEPSVLLLDEALSQLDTASTVQIKNVICALKAAGKAVLMVEHDPDNLDIADRMYCFEGNTVNGVNEINEINEVGHG